MQQWYRPKSYGIMRGQRTFYNVQTQRKRGESKLSTRALHGGMQTREGKPRRWATTQKAREVRPTLTEFPRGGYFLVNQKPRCQTGAPLITRRHDIGGRIRASGGNIGQRAATHGGTQMPGTREGRQKRDPVAQASGTNGSGQKRYRDGESIIRRQPVRVQVLNGAGMVVSRPQ